MHLSNINYGYSNLFETVCCKEVHVTSVFYMLRVTGGGACASLCVSSSSFAGLSRRSVRACPRIAAVNTCRRRLMFLKFVTAVLMPSKFYVCRGIFR